jgi:signal transduction histidine kinase
MRINELRHASGGSRAGLGPLGVRDSSLERRETIARPNHARRDATTDRIVAPTWREQMMRSWLGQPRVDLAVLASCTPVLTGALLAAGVPHATGFRVIACWSLAQCVLGLLLLEVHVDGTGRRRSDAESPATRAPRDGSVELESHREKDRLHEVRTTMAGIGITHRLLRDRRDRLSGAERARLEQLYDREISRLERLLQDDVRANPESVDVHTAIAPVVDSLRLRGQLIRWEGTRACAAGSGDDVAEIVHILLHNAMRHAPGSEVSLQVETTATEVLLRVSDTGPGVPAAMVPHLFERGTRRPDSPGEGIGLPIARRLAREMGGDLRFDGSATRPGAAFLVTLRAVPEGAPCLTRRR